ncbi:T9SS type A sorting domain-containing protein [Bacteroidota bacterium]
MKKIVLLTIIFLNSLLLQSQHWQEQIVLEGEARAFCFDNNGDVLYSSKMSNGLYAICKYSYEKDTVSVIFKGTKTIDFLHVCNNGTILGFNNEKCYRSSDDGLTWTAFEGEFDVEYRYTFSKSFMIELNDSILILRSDGNQSYKSTDNGKIWSQIIIEGIDELFIFPINIDNLIAYTVREHFLYITSDSGVNWIKTEQDSNFTIRFIQKNTNNNDLYALHIIQGLVKSEDYGLNWEVCNANNVIEGRIRDFIIGKDEKIYLLDITGKLYSYELNTYTIEKLSDDSSIIYLFNYDFYKPKYGLYLNDDNELFILSQTISKFNMTSNSWQSIKEKQFNKDYISHQSHFIFGIIGNNNKVLFKNEEDREIYFCDLSNDKKFWQGMPTGNSGISDYYEVAPSGELLIGNFIPYYKEDTDTLEFVKTKYSISNDNGFSRKLILLDTNYTYYNNSTFDMGLGVQENGQMTYNEKGDIHIISYEKNYRSTNNDFSFDTINNDFLHNKILKIFRTSPDGNLYLILSDRWNYYTNILYYSSDNGNNWELNNNSLDSTSVGRINNVQFKSNGEIFISESDLDDGLFANSTDFGKTWKTNHMGPGANNWDVYSLFIDSADNVYSNASIYIGPQIYYTNKNYYPIDDTCHFFTTKSGDQFAKIYIHNWDYQKNIYSSNNGKTWVDFDEDWGWGIDIKSNNKGDIFWYHDNILFKFIRDSVEPQNLLNDTTEYSIFIAVEDEKKMAGLSDIQISPNPAENILNISFSLGFPVNIEIKLLDISGTELEIITNQHFHDGEHTLSWDCSGYPSGSYYILFRMNGEYEVRKLVVIR